MTPTKNESLPELLPCPFCGGDPERIDFGPGDAENEGGSCIACKRCQSSGPVEFGYKENFISNWNRRAALTREAPTEGGVLCYVVETKESCDTGPKYWVMIERDGKRITPYHTFIRGRAEYEVASWNHVLNGAPEPNILDYDTDQPYAPQPAPQRMAQGEDDNPNEFGANSQPNPKALYWQGRARCWQNRAIQLGWKITEDDEPTQPPHHDRGEGALVQVALRNLPQYIGKASFSSSVDKQAALNCVEVLAAALTEAKQQGPGEAITMRYFANGPEGSFMADDFAFADRITHHFEPEEWTITDTQEAPQVEANRQTGEG